MSSTEKVWFVTGTGRGLGADIVRARDYAAGKFGIVGWMESHAPEIEPFGIGTMLVGLDKAPLRFVAGVDAMQPAEAKANTLLAQIEAHRALSASLVTDPQEA